MEGKIGLLTLDSHNYNFGGLLQGYALQHMIGTLNYTCEIIDYDNAELSTFSPKRSMRYLTLKKCFDKLHGLCTKEETNSHIINMVTKRKKRFDAFRQTQMQFSRPCTRKELSEIALQYDVIVCGSDQIWNPSFNRPSFFLDFVPDSIGKVIYAASIGRDELTGYEKKAYEKYLKPLQWISVRESGAKALLEPITADRSIKLVLDPTLLLEPVHWRKLAGEGRLVREKYVFCYFLGMDEEKKGAAMEFASDHGLKVISIPYLHGRYESLDDGFSEEEFDIGPVEFLNLIQNADFVLTDSFHASLFSILFQKNFRVFGRKWGGGDMNTRIHTLLGYIGRSDYLISPSQLKESKKKEEQGWNFDGIDRKRDESIEWLKTALVESIKNQTPKRGR